MLFSWALLPDKNKRMDGWMELQLCKSYKIAAVTAIDRPLHKMTGS